MKKRIEFILILYFSLAINSICAQTVQGSFESVFQRYQKGQQFVGTSSLTENLTAWKNERIYAQIVLWSQTKQNNLSYEISPLTALTDTISAEAVQLLFAHDVIADRYARNCGTYPQPRMDSVKIADALSFKPLVSVTADDPVKIWVRINVPENVSAGIYSGTIKVKQNNTLKLAFVLNVEVLNKEIPNPVDYTFHLDLWQYPYQLLKYYNINHPKAHILPWSTSHFGMITPLYRLLADAGQKAVSAFITDDVMGQPSMVKWILKADSTWQYDFTDMDTWVNMLDAMGISKQINCFSTIGMGIDSLTYFEETSSSFKRLYAPMFSKTYYDRWNDFLTAFKIHLTNRKIFDKTVVYLDEVESKMIPRLDSLIHGNGQSWKIGLSYFHPLTQAESDIMYDISGNLGFATNQGREGKISTFYTSCAQTIPNTYVTVENSVAESTWLAWYVANQNLDGFLRWAYDFWTLDDPLNVQDGYFTSGENSFVYRSSNEMNTEMYTSYRLEMLRKGIQDFEKIKILKAELQLSNDPLDEEALRLLNDKIAQFHENNGTGAETLVREGGKLLNDIVRGDFSYCKVSGADSTIAYTQWIGVMGSSTPIGNTWVGSYPGGYSHYTDGKITALPGDSLTLTIENSPNSYCARTAVWIDWSGDNDFEDDGECVWSGGVANSCNNATSNTFNIIIPVRTKPGVKRMRIQVRDAYVDEPIPCGEVLWSSTRDFDIVVADSYCKPLTKYNKLYFLRKASTSTCVENFYYSNDVMPSQGYNYDDTNIFTVEKGTSFLMDIENSTLSKCARTAIWVDWNKNGNFDGPSELIAELGKANSCDNPLSYRVPVTVPNSAFVGETRMRIQLRDSYQEAPQSCLIDYVTGTTDFKLNIVEPSGLHCFPEVIYPNDGDILSDTTVNFTWTANNSDVTEWKLKISDADSDTGMPVYFEQEFAGTNTSVQVSQLPHYGENLLVELFWKINGKWHSAVTYNKAKDVYCQSMGFSDISYFIYSIQSYNAFKNISFQSGDSPEKGYCHIKKSAIAVNPGSSFILEVKESSASKCAFTKVWIDWNGDGDFTDIGEEVYLSGLPEYCKNDNEHRIHIDVPSEISLGMKRLRIRLCNSWLPPLEPCGGSGEITTYDMDIEVVAVSKSIEQSKKQTDNSVQNYEPKLMLYGDQLYLSNNNVAAGTLRMYFYTTDGRLVKLLDNVTGPVYVGDISKGTYLITIKDEKGEVLSTKFRK